MIPAAFVRQSRHMLELRRTLDGIRDNVGSMLEEAQVYIGLNDADTKEQLLETEEYISALKSICRTHEVPFSFDVIEGGYMHDDGEYTEETSIVLTFIDVSQETVDAIAKELCALFNQESVLITVDRIRVRSIRESF